VNRANDLKADKFQLPNGGPMSKAGHIQKYKEIA